MLKAILILAIHHQPADDQNIIRSLLCHVEAKTNTPTSKNAKPSTLKKVTKKKALLKTKPKSVPGQRLISSLVAASVRGQVKRKKKAISHAPAMIPRNVLSRLKKAFPARIPWNRKLKPA